MHVGIGDRLDQGHAQAVGAVDPFVADVADLAAGILLDGQLPDVDRAAVEGHLAVDRDDRRALESGRDAAVEVLLAGDVDLVDDLHPHQQGNGDRAVQGLPVQLERRSVIHLVGAYRLVLQQIDDLLACLELHQGGAVVLAHLRQGRAHMTQDLRVVLLGIAACRAAAEEFAVGQQLLVDLQPHFQADFGVVFRGP